MPPVKLNKDNIKLIKFTGKRNSNRTVWKFKNCYAIDCVPVRVDSGENIVLKIKEKYSYFKNINRSLVI